MSAAHDRLMVRAHTLVMECSLIVSDAPQDTPEQRATLRAACAGAAAAVLDDLSYQEAGYLHHILVMWWVYRELNDASRDAILEGIAEPCVEFPDEDPVTEAWLPLVPPLITAAVHRDHPFIIHLWTQHCDPAWAPHMCALWATPGKPIPPTTHRRRPPLELSTRSTPWETSTPTTPPA